MPQLPPPRYDYWYSYDELTTYLHQAAELFPEMCALT